MRIAPPVELNVDQRSRFEAIVRSRMLPARLIERSSIVLLAAAGCRNKQIAAELHITPEKAARWRKRYLQLGLAGLEKDAPRPGRKPRYERRSQNRPQSGDAKPFTGGAKLDRPGGPRSIPEVFCGTPEGCIKWSYTLKYGAV